MVSPARHNYRYHQNQPPSQENPKYNFRKIIWSERHFNLSMDFWGWDIRIGLLQTIL